MLYTGAQVGEGATRHSLGNYPVHDWCVVGVWLVCGWCVIVV